MVRFETAKLDDSDKIGPQNERIQAFGEIDPQRTYLELYHFVDRDQ